MKTVMPFDSRQEMSAPDYEIQHKRDNCLQDVGLHHHDFYEIFFLISGDVTYRIEGRLYKIEPGDILLVSPKELHQVSIRTDVGPYERYVLWIDGKYLDSLPAEDTNLKQVLDPMWPEYTNLLRPTREWRSSIRTQMETLFQESEDSLFGSRLEKRSLMTHLLVSFNRIALQKGSTFAVTDGSDDMVSALVDYINEHYRERLTLDMLAELFYVSKYHMSHEFQKCMGTGIYRYIQKKRLQIAKQLLSRGEKPKAVSSLCGFGDYPGFYRAFVEEYGVSPRTYADSVR